MASFDSYADTDSHDMRTLFNSLFWQVVRTGMDLQHFYASDLLLDAFGIFHELREGETATVWVRDGGTHLQLPGKDPAPDTAWQYRIRVKRRRFNTFRCDTQPYAKAA